MTPSLAETRWNPSHTNEVSLERYLDTSPIPRDPLRRKGSIEVSLFCAPEKVHVCKRESIYIYIYIIDTFIYYDTSLAAQGFWRYHPLIL